MLRGIIFDLDGTLVQSNLDFDRIRQEMNLPQTTPILEALETMDVRRAARCREILERHERQAANQATVMPGAADFLDCLDGLKLLRGVVTRNSRQSALEMLSQFSHRFDPVISRDDGPVKPDPWAILQICEAWNLLPQQVAVIGDFRFDIEADRSAGAKTVFFTQGRDPGNLPGIQQAHFRLTSFLEVKELVLWLSQDDLGPSE